MSTNWRSTIPGYLPSRLTISLWDFSWYTMSGPDEPFHNLEKVLDELIERGYNTIRICAAPILLYGDLGVAANALAISSMGGAVGEGTRWYNPRGGITIDLQSRLFELLALAKKKSVWVILSSWEYQQSPAFSETSDWNDALMDIPPGMRFEVLAQCWVRMLEEIKARGLRDVIAYVELHNEVDLSLVGVNGRWTDSDHWDRKTSMEDAIGLLRSAHPDLLHTTSYGIPPFLHMDTAPSNSQVAHHHLYVYGVLQALFDWSQIRAEPPVYPTAEMKSLLRPDAPDFDTYRAGVKAWTLDATITPLSYLYASDYANGAAWDAWLYRNYALHELEMRRGIDYRLSAISTWSKLHGVPAVIGEGWVGFTPAASEFEDGPIGQEITQYAVQSARELDFWGIVVGSNRAPHHSGWSDISHQLSINEEFIHGGTRE